MLTDIVSRWMYAGISYVVAGVGSSSPGQLVVVATDAHGGSRRVAWTDPDERVLADIALEWNTLPALARTRRAEGLLGRFAGALAASGALQSA